MEMVYDADLGDYICSGAPMPWVVVSAKPHENHVIDLEFKDGKKGVYDARPLLEQRVFAPLRELPFFMRAHAENGTVVWSDDIDIAPEHLYEECRPIAGA